MFVAQRATGGDAPGPRLALDELDEIEPNSKMIPHPGSFLMRLVTWLLFKKTFWLRLLNVCLTTCGNGQSARADEEFRTRPPDASLKTRL